MSRGEFTRTTQVIIDEYATWKAAKDAEEAAKHSALAKRNAEWDSLIACAQNHTGARRHPSSHVAVSLSRIWSSGG